MHLVCTTNNKILSNFETNCEVTICVTILHNRKGDVIRATIDNLADPPFSCLQKLILLSLSSKKGVTEFHLRNTLWRHIWVPLIDMP